MDFPESKFDYETLTTLNIFENIHRLINVKIHIHHSHMTGRIYSYVHDFCNMKVRQNHSQFSCVAHKFFGFNIFFLIKRIKLSFWEIKDLNIGWSELLTVTFGNIGSQVKCFDTMKYFLTSLGNVLAL